VVFFARYSRRADELSNACCNHASKTIHAKIANHRKNALHKFSRELVIHCGEIYVGHVSSVKLVKTKMAKSVLDASWGQLKTMLDYKCAHAGIVFKGGGIHHPNL